MLYPRRQMSADGVNAIPEQFLWCRDVLHAWAPHDAKIVKRPGKRAREIHRILQCRDCGTLKTQRLSQDGMILGHSYSYPKGYLNQGQGRLTVADRAKIRKLTSKIGGQK